MSEVNRFPIEIFPNEFRAIIEHNKEIQNFDTNLSALSYLSATATTIGGNVQINNGGYSTSPILWSVLVANSGMKKSHIMEFPFKFLKEHDRNEMLRFNSECLTIEKGEFPIQPKTFLLKDSTPEAMSKCLNVNPKGVVLFKDEMARMMKDFNKYGNGSGEQDSLLELFNGNDLSIHRATKPTLYITNPCVNLIGGIQPERLSLMANEDSFSGGFYYRLLFSRPLERKPNEYVLSEINKDIECKSTNIFQEIFNYPETELKVSNESKELYQNWFNSNNIKYFEDEWSMSLQSKLETYVWRFCIVLDILDQISNGKTRNIITKETMEKALILVEYFRIESTEIYKDTFREGILESESDSFQKEYRKLTNREYTTQELIKHFTCLGGDMINKKLAEKELFVRIKRGLYKKSILHAAK